MTPTAADHTCEWCPNTATAVKEIKHKLGRGTVPTGMFMFACRDHIETMNRHIAARAEAGVKR